MAMVVKNNMSAVRTLNTLNSNTSALQKSLQKVSSGMKINSAQDDASGYAISERMRVRIRSLDQANQNSQNDSSLMKTAEGAVGNTVEILRALKEKAINAANDSNTDEDRQTIQKEINQFIDQIDDNALVQFNGKYLVDGSKNNAFFETKSILLNQSLKTGTTSTSALTELANRAGDSLGIQTSDQYQVSWVQNGTIHFTSGRVESNNIADILTLDGKVKKTTTDDEGKETTTIVDGKISQVKETTKGGLISGAADLTTPVTKYTDPVTLTAETALDLETNAPDLVTAYDNYISANGGTKGDTVLFSQLTQDVTATDRSTVTVNMFSPDADDKKSFDTGLGIKYDSTTSKYVITPTPTEELTIYKYNDEYELEPETLDPGSYMTDVTDPYVQFVAGTGGASNTGTLISSLPTQLQVSALTAFTDLAAPSAGDTVGSYTIPDNAEDISWVILDDNGDEVDGTNYSLAPSAADNTFLFASSDGGTTQMAADYQFGIKFTIPPEEEEETEGLVGAWDKFGKEVYTPDKTEGIAFGATTAGVDDQISGLTISILDQDGNVKKAANAALDQFKQYQRAENKTGDMSLNFHIGSEANVSFKVGMGDMRAQALGLKGSDGTRIDVYTKEHANAAINVIENALTKALDQQTTIGAIEARLEYTSTNLTTSSENVQAAESTIRDADMAKEMTNYTKSNVLLQAAQAMLAQANQNSSAVLSLLQ